MKATLRKLKKSGSKEPRPESARRRLARLWKRVVAGEVTFASAAMADDPFSRTDHRRKIE